MVSVTKRGRGSWLVYQRNAGTHGESDGMPDEEEAHAGGDA